MNKTKATPRLLTLFLLLASVATVRAQGSDLITQAKSFLNPSRGLQIEYQMTIGNEPPTTGYYYAIGEAFYLESEELKAWHNGSGDLWVYLAANGEVNLTRPLKEDLQELNPLLNIDRLSPTLFLLKEWQEGNKRFLTATPKQSRGEVIEWLELQTDKQGKPQVLKLRQVGMRETIHLKVISLIQETNKAMSQSGFFSFTPNKLPGTAVIDLR